MTRASKREQIVDAAEALIATDGAAKLTTKSVAKRAAVSEAAIYYHFDDKFDLLLAVMGRQLPALQAALRPLPDQVGARPLSENLERAARAIAAFWYDLLPALGPALGDPAETRRLGLYLDQRNLGPQRGVAALAEYLRRENAAGHVRRTTDPHAVAQAILGVCQASAFEGLLTGKSKRAVRAEAAAQTRAIATELTSAAADEER
jgi:AcrR family transcriptional regulator